MPLLRIAALVLTALAQVAPAGGSNRALPAGANGGPYAVTVDGAGTVRVNEISTDTVVRIDSTGAQQVVTLASKNVGIRKMNVDTAGKLWYMGRHNGRLGIVY